MLGLTLALMMAAAPPADPAPLTPRPPRRITKLLEQADGTSARTAYRVRSVGEEYQIVRALGLEVRSQALLNVGSRSFDVLTVVDPRTGEERRLWFDISSFFGRGF